MRGEGGHPLGTTFMNLSPIKHVLQVTKYYNMKKMKASTKSLSVKAPLELVFLNYSYMLLVSTIRSQSTNVDTFSYCTVLDIHCSIYVNKYNVGRA